MAMSRKEYEFAAEVVRVCRFTSGDKKADLVQNSFIALFQEYGSRFDKERFLQACKLKGEE